MNINRIALTIARIIMLTGSIIITIGGLLLLTLTVFDVPITKDIKISMMTIGLILVGIGLFLTTTPNLIPFKTASKSTLWMLHIESLMIAVGGAILIGTSFRTEISLPQTIKVIMILFGGILVLFGLDESRRIIRRFRS